MILSTEKPEDNEEEAEVATKHLFGFTGGFAYKLGQNVPKELTYMGKTRVARQKTGNFQDPPTQSFADVIYGWSLTERGLYSKLQKTEK